MVGVEGDRGVVYPDHIGREYASDGDANGGCVGSEMLPARVTWMPPFGRY